MRALILPTADPAARAMAASFMERLAYPKPWHRQRAVDEAIGRVLAGRADLRTILQRRPATAADHPLDAMIWNPMHARRWQDARALCRCLRLQRASIAQAEARMGRMAREDAEVFNARKAA